MKTQAPPQLPKEKQPFIRYLMPLLMLVAVVAMMAAMIMSGMGRNPMSYMFPLMMLGSLAMMFQPGANVEDQRRSFHRHIDALRDALTRAHQQQREEMALEQPHPASLWTFVHAASPEDSEGLVPTVPGHVRVGVAPQRPRETVEVEIDSPPEDLEPVSALALRQLVEEFSSIDAPVSIDIPGFGLVAVTGECAPGMVRAMQAQLVAQDPDAVTITGPYSSVLPHRGPLTIAFCEGQADPTAQASVVVAPSAECLEQAKATGLVLQAHRGGKSPAADGAAAGEKTGAAAGGKVLLSAWTVDGWVPFGVADQLSEWELAALCRSQYRIKESSSLLELPGGDLRAPIGFAPAPVYLDIKEAALGGVGPHGLCVGATGSGKSEFLKAVVIAFANTHSADELNFILVDFKGGASFLGMERLPHTSAIITNLSDEAGLVDRMQDALLGEMHRRQEKLRAAGLTTAREFNRRYPGDMPALFIIVDEFSELLHARPEFADVFAAIGRLGRSLRMHLLLATQRFEEGRLRGLESHISYRVALRTFSAAESRALIGSPAAFELPTTPGAAILSAHEQTRFQSAYVSGYENRQDRRLIRVIEVLDPPAGHTPGRDGGLSHRSHLAGEVSLPGDATSAEAAPMDRKTTADVVIDALAGPNRHPVWLPPLPAMVPAATLMAGDPPAEPLHMPLALEDKPFDGVQTPWMLDVTRKNWVFVGQPQTGKTAAVRAAVVGLVLTTPGLIVYVIDAGGSLASLGRLPQVAAVVGPEDMPRVLDDIEHGTGDRLLVVDGLDHVGDEEQRLIRLAGTGLEQGVRIIATSLRWNIRPSLRDALTGHLEFRLNPLDSQHREMQKALPDLPGRAISPGNTQIHCAFVSDEDIEYVRQVTVARGERDYAMATLPTQLSYPLPADPAAFAIGGPTLQPVRWDWRNRPHLTVVGSGGMGATTTLRTLIAAITAEHTLAPAGVEPPAGSGGEVEFLVTDTRRGLLGQPGYCVAEQFRRRLGEWVDILRQRIPGPEVTPQQLRARSWWTGPELFVVVDDADSDPGLDLVLDLLPYAVDIGLHLVTARRSGLFARSSFQPLQQALRDHTAWLLLGAPREDGPIAGQTLAPAPAGRAVMVTDQVWHVHVLERRADDV